MPSLKDRYSYKIGHGRAEPGPAGRARPHGRNRLPGDARARGPRSRPASSTAASTTSCSPLPPAEPVPDCATSGEASNSGVELDVQDARAPARRPGRELHVPAAGEPQRARRSRSSTRRGTRGGCRSPARSRRPCRSSAASTTRPAGETQNEAGHYLDVPSFAVVNVKAVWTIRRGLDAELGAPQRLRQVLLARRRLSRGRAGPCWRRCGGRSEGGRPQPPPSSATRPRPGRARRPPPCGARATPGTAPCRCRRSA